MQLPAAAGHVVRRLAGSARSQMAVKAGLAAVLSWLAAEALTRALGGGLDSYLYYAPLGAVVATYPTIADSARTARQAVIALSVGAALGLLVHHVLPQGVLALAVAVSAGVALGALPGMGDLRSWVPIVALFVLIIGADDATTYALAYVGLTALGAVCGVAVNLLLPSLRLQHGQEAVERLRAVLVDQLGDLAGGLRQPGPMSPEDWRRRKRHVGPTLQETRLAMAEVLAARTANPRGPRHRGEIDRQHRLASRLERVAVLAEDLPDVLTWTSGVDGPSPSLDGELAEAVADVLDSLAEVIRVDGGAFGADRARLRELDVGMRRVTQLFGRRRDLDAVDMATLGAVVANVRAAVVATSRSV